MNSLLAPYSTIKYGISSSELKAARSCIINDIVNNNFIENPIEYMTLRKYFDIIHGAILSACDQNGIVRDRFGETWHTEFKKSDQRNIEPVEIARNWMDGRGLFTEHFNGTTTNLNY